MQLPSTLIETFNLKIIRNGIMPTHSLREFLSRLQSTPMLNSNHFGGDCAFMRLERTAKRLSQANLPVSFLVDFFSNRMQQSEPVASYRW